MAENIKPRLKNIDELLLGADTPPAGKNAVTEVEIEKLTPYKGQHPFRLYEGERLDDMVESIRTNGVLVPVIVRRDGEILEILAGHNRVNAAKLAGLTTVPTIILDEISDEDALVYVIETNLIQRGFNDMSHSERAAVIALHHSKMFSQGKRNDILEQIKMLENPDEYKQNSTLPQVGAKLRTDAKIGAEYSLSKNTVARYVRVNKLIAALQTRLDDEELAFIPAVTLSYLSEQEQTLVNDCMELNGYKVDMKKADLLRSYSEQGKLDDDNVYLILSGEASAKPKTARIPTVKIKTAVYSKYFTEDQSKKEVQAIVEKALDLYFAQRTDVDAIFDSLPGKRL